MAGAADELYLVGEFSRKTLKLYESLKKGDKNLKVRLNLDSEKETLNTIKKVKLHR